MSLRPFAHRQLPDVSFAPRYASDTNDLVKDFFVPSLSRAVRYDRAVGYFTAGSVARLAPGLGPLLDWAPAGSTPIRVVASPNLPTIDAAHISLGYQRFEEAVERDLHSARPELSEPLRAITWMIEHGFMEFFLIPGYLDGSTCLYHEKIGVVEDEAGNYLTFEGSPNETFAGLGENIESFPVHCSWIPEHAAHAAAAREAVDDLFRPESHRQRPLRVEPFPQALLEGMIKTYTPRRPESSNRRPKDRPMATTSATEPQPLPTVPARIPGFKDYQLEAIRSWLGAEGRGIFAMATGTGKTVTACGAVMHVSRAYQEPPGLTVVILVPDKSLVSMWESELAEWGVATVCSTANKPLDALNAALRKQRVFGGPTFVIWNVDSAVNDRFQTRLVDFPAPRVLIADECHAFGAPTYQQLLRDDLYPHRLGLSATVDRHMDDEGTEVVRSFFGDELVSLSIKDAIDLGALCHYTYHPVLVPLTDEEMEEYTTLSRKIAQRFAASDSESFADLEVSAKTLMLDRARVLWHAQAKLPAFRERLEARPDEAHDALIYVAEGPSPLYPHERQSPGVHAIAESLSLRFADFVGDTPLPVRERLLSELASGALDGLVAMKCLDQGIDVPSARVAHFLASTRNPRQYIQRRGRVLRRDPNNPDKVATIYDYIAHPSEPGDEFQLERRLVAREVLRAHEMASAADNRYAAINVLSPLLDEYLLWDHIEDHQ